MRIFFSILILLSVYACADEKIQPQVNGSSSYEELPAHESWNSKIVFSDDGNIKAVLYTDYLKKYEIQRLTLLDVVKIEFYNSDQKVATTLTSKRGKVDDATRNMIAIENVVAINDSGTVLKTEELMWRNSDQKIVTDRFVSIKSSKEIIEGFGFESDQQLRNYVVFNVTYSATVQGQNQK